MPIVPAPFVKKTLSFSHYIIFSLLSEINWAYFFMSLFYQQKSEKRKDECSSQLHGRLNMWSLLQVGMCPDEN